MPNTFFACGCYNIYDNLIGVYHIRIFVKADTPICNTSEKPCEIWRDRAGAYGIQDPFGMKFIKKINGCYYNVVGLPVSRLYEELKKLGAI